MCSLHIVSVTRSDWFTCIDQATVTAFTRLEPECRKIHARCSKFIKLSQSFIFLFLSDSEKPTHPPRIGNSLDAEVEPAKSSE